MIYTIYHVLGTKVGCTTDLPTRTAENKSKYGQEIEVVVLETFDGTEQEAGDREWYWADEFGYPRGVHYTLALEQRRNQARKSAFSPKHNSNNVEHQEKWRAAGWTAPNRISKQIVTCPHCGVVGARLGMARWHFDRCKKK